MTLSDTDLEAIRARDAAGPYRGLTAVDRRALLAEVDRLRAQARRVREALEIAQDDLAYHAGHESAAADYNTPRGWRDVTDLVADVHAALASTDD